MGAVSGSDSAICMTALVRRTPYFLFAVTLTALHLGHFLMVEDGLKAMKKLTRCVHTTLALPCPALHPYKLHPEPNPKLNPRWRTVSRPFRI